MFSDDLLHQTLDDQDDFCSLRIAHFVYFTITFLIFFFSFSSLMLQVAASSAAKDTCILLMTVVRIHLFLEVRDDIPFVSSLMLQCYKLQPVRLQNIPAFY